MFTKPLLTPPLADSQHSKARTFIFLQRLSLRILSKDPNGWTKSGVSKT